jgi:hypothetical protein
LGEIVECLTLDEKLSLTQGLGSVHLHKPGILLSKKSIGLIEAISDILTLNLLLQVQFTRVELNHGGNGAQLLLDEPVYSIVLVLDIIQNLSDFPEHKVSLLMGSMRIALQSFGQSDELHENTTLCGPLLDICLVLADFLVQILD